MLLSVATAGRAVWAAASRARSGSCRRGGIYRAASRGHLHWRGWPSGLASADGGDVVGALVAIDRLIGAGVHAGRRRPRFGLGQEQTNWRSFRRELRPALRTQSFQVFCIANKLSKP